MGSLRRLDFPVEFPVRREIHRLGSGLAASYDKLRRFDLADQAYAQAIRLGGETVQILNDQGYSYMLRGNLNAARRKFEKAYSLDPGNPVIANNLELLNGSRRFIERPPNNQP
ncbi:MULTISPECIES: tetratricopeptide repeat protein [Bradyrhizobium]|uniref:tetratricopeptide repeat protein n=1 Tax=Bradyrhizobium TaxID=374 RepID=UPI001FD8A5A8|nr:MULTISPECIES: tetratricopeptide repeat protein [Bradyrhizobium]